MQLIGFIHGIGNFYPTSRDKVELLEHMQQEAEQTYGECRVFFLSYENYLDNLFQSKLVYLAASLASAMYANTPVVGSLLADYGTDIFEYYLQENVRRDISALIARQLAATIGDSNQPVSGITLVGHSLGSLVLLRLLALTQMMSDAKGTVQSSDVLLDEMLSSPQLAADLTTISTLPIQPVLAGSPAFSRVKGIKAATRRMALKESSPADVLNNQGRLGHPLLINVLSQKLAQDPLSGKVEESLPAINLEGNWTHRNVLLQFGATMRYLKSKQPTAV